MEIRTVESFLTYYERVRERTMRVVAYIPPEELEWSYAPSKFSFGDLLRHIAALERFMWAETVQGKPARYPGHGRELADGHSEVLAFVVRMHGESVQIFRGLHEEDLQAKCLTPSGQSITIWKWLRAMTEHEIHHRGQLYVYLGMLGATTPPLFGLTSEEVLAGSQK